MIISAGGGKEASPEWCHHPPVSSSQRHQTHSLWHKPLHYWLILAQRGVIARLTKHRTEIPTSNRFVIENAAGHLLAVWLARRRRACSHTPPPPHRWGTEPARTVQTNSIHVKNTVFNGGFLKTCPNLLRGFQKFTDISQVLFWWCINLN